MGADGKVQVNDIIKSFQLGDKADKRVDLEDEKKTMTQQKMMNKMRSLRQKCTEKEYFKITFLRGLRVLSEPIYVFPVKKEAAQAKKSRRLATLERLVQEIQEVEC